MEFAKRIQLCVLLGLVCYVPTSVADEARKDTQDHAGPLRIPSVVRYTNLPTRLLLRSEFVEPEITEILPDSYIVFFNKLLDGDYDSELHRDAAQSLERVGRQRLAKPETYVQSLRNRLNNSDSRVVTRACAIALAAANQPKTAEDLAAFCLPNNEVICAHVEPRLAQWNSKALLETWQARINAPDKFSDQLLILACQCLAEINDSTSTETLIALAANELIQFPVRHAAAEGAGRLDPAKAAELAKSLASGKILQRLLAAALLKNATSAQARLQLDELCDDPENAIAAIAWDYLENLDNKLLATKLERGIVHPEPNVRKVAIRVLNKIPSEQHSSWLNELLRDEHIEVRNLARSALHDLATNQPSLRQQIVDSAGRNLADSLSNWQQIEQSLILLGQQRHPDFQADCIPLLTHPRNEILVSAAWLLHLMPRSELADEVINIANQQFETLKEKTADWSISDPARLEALSHGLKYLFHVAGYERRKNVRDLASEMFSKSAPTLPETRAAGLWALGMAFSDSADADMQKRWAARLHDDSMVNPEMDVVKAASALSLGLQGIESSIPILELAHEKYSVEGEIGLSVSTSLRMFGKNPPSPPERQPRVIGNWPVSPLLN